MTPVVSPTDVHAIKVADRWLRVRVPDGQVAYAIPSQFEPGLGYVVDTDSCTCPDFERQQAGQQVCKHVLAVRLHLEQLSPPAPPATPPRPVHA